jgi:hypothetical protein
MARPRKAAQELRSQMLRFTVTPDEYIRIHKQAAESQLTPAEYCRRRALEQDIVIRKTQGIDDALFLELRRIGVNLNQAVKQFNATGSAPPELLSTARAVEIFLKENLGHGPESSG